MQLQPILKYSKNNIWFFWMVPKTAQQLTWLMWSTSGPISNPLVLDNCHIHHTEEIHQLVEDETHMFMVLFGSCSSHLYLLIECKLIFCHPTHLTTTWSSKPSPQSKPFCDTIGRVDHSLSLIAHVTTSCQEKLQDTPRHQGTLCNVVRSLQFVSWSAIHSISCRLLPICCSKIENAHNVESDIAININFLRHILISWCHMILNLNFFLFCYSDWQKLLWRFGHVWSEQVV